MLTDAVTVVTRDTGASVQEIIQENTARDVSERTGKHVRDVSERTGKHVRDVSERTGEHCERRK